MLFATLDPTTRKVVMPGGREVLFTDTVGFIQKLPTEIVAAFRATLEEIIDADVLLHVVDATHANVAAQIEAVEDTLAELEVDHLPLVTAFNKADLLEDGDDPLQRTEFDRAAVVVSARTGQGMDDLLAAIEAAMVQYLGYLHVFLPYTRGDLLSLLHERGQVDQENHLADGIEVYARLPERLMPYFVNYRRE
jgi:GTP-binding protein HflX